MEKNLNKLEIAAKKAAKFFKVSYYNEKKHNDTDCYHNGTYVYLRKRDNESTKIILMSGCRNCGDRNHFDVTKLFLDK